VEFLFTPQRAVTLTLDPFTVTVLGRQADSIKINVRFREEVRTTRRYEPRFRWVNPASPFPAGEQGDIVLELTNWDPQKNAPRGFLWGRAPGNAILEDGSPTEAGEGVFRYTFGVIPIDESDITIEALTFEAEGFTLNVPAITIRVAPASAAEAASTVAAEEAPEEGSDGNEGNEIPLTPAAPEPDWTSPPVNPEAVFPFFRGEYQRTIAKVKALWESNKRAEALAEIRRNERDSLSGPFLVPLRKEMEQALGFDFTENERWQPLGISIVSWVILGFLFLFIVSILLVFRPRPGTGRSSIPWNLIPRKSVTSGRRSGFKTVIALILLLGLAVVFLEVGLGNFLINRLNSSRNAAVLERTPAYRVPDIKGAINDHFDEGQPVIVSDYRLDWCYAETSDGRFGWVPREAVIPY